MCPDSIQVPRICPICNLPFINKNFNSKNPPRYCSRTCYYQSLKNSVTQKCGVCGISFETKPSHLQTGRGKYCSKNCLTIKNTKHGEAINYTQSKEYRAWLCMKRRVFNLNYESYKNYGGRGITICEGWKESFESFLIDMGRSPSPDHSVDRKNNDGHYSCGHCLNCKENGWPANCRWATIKEQAINKQTNKFITFDGKTKCISEWARTTGIHKARIRLRLKSGWSVERALTTPVYQRGKYPRKN